MKSDKIYPVLVAVASVVAYAFLLWYLRPAGFAVFWFTVCSVLLGAAAARWWHLSYPSGHSKASPGSQPSASLPWQLHQVFLFNTLHNIVALTFVNPDKSRMVIEELAELIRMIMVMEKEPTTLLAQEVRCAERLLSIEGARLGDRLRVTKSISADCLEEPLPSLTLLPIVQRTIRQGVDLSEQPVELGLHARRQGRKLSIEIVETSRHASEVPDRPDAEDDPELQMLRELLNRHYGQGYSLKTVMLTQGGRKVCLELPSQLRPNE